MRWLVLACLAGCLAPVSELCGDGRVCGPGTRCGLAGQTWLCVVATCGNGQLDPDEACDDGNNLSGDGCPADCRATCGDGVLDPGEACDDGNAVDGDGCDSNCGLPVCGNAIVDPGEACDDGNAVDGDGCDADCTVSALTQQAYVKASNPAYDDVFGTSLALSRDGATLVVGAPGEASAAVEVDGDQRDDSAPGAGAVYVYSRRTAWRQQGYLKAPNSGAGDGFGGSVALSADGAILVVGATGEASAAPDRPADNTAAGAGAVYLFVRRGLAWQATAYVKAPSPVAGEAFGASVALSADGATLAVGASGGAGAVYVFVRAGAAWAFAARVVPASPGVGDDFGRRVALSGDGTMLVVTAPDEASAAPGIDGDASDDGAPGTGAAYVFVRDADTWRQDAYLKASNADPGEHFGRGLALARDGATLAIGADDEASAAIGFAGVQEDDSAPGAGAVYLFARVDGRWTQQVYVKASNTNGGDGFGAAIALSDDGARLAVAAPREGSAATGVGGAQRDNTAHDAGAVYLFARDGQRWRAPTYVKASNTGENDAFGGSVALAGDGGTLAVGGPGDDSVAPGIDGDQRATYADGSAGAVYVFH